MDDSRNIITIPDPASVEAEAAAWVARLDHGQMTDADYAELREWQMRSPIHREALARFSGLLEEFASLKQFSSYPPTESEEALVPSAIVSRPGWNTIGLLAASIAVIVAGTFWYTALRVQPSIPVASRPDALTRYATVVGSQKLIDLPDGSKMSLNTNTRVDVAFSKTRRDIYLRQGEAYFDVAHQNRRPFTVHVNDQIVRDIGTAFNVRMVSRAVEVTVAKGSVELAHNVNGAGTPAEKRVGIASAGHRIVFDHEIKSTTTVSDDDIGRHLAWRTGVLVYADEPLSKVIEDFSRYTNLTIDLRDPALRNLPIGGYFAVGKVDVFFAALEDTFGIRAKWRDPTHVELYGAPHPPVNTQKR